MTKIRKFLIGFAVLFGAPNLSAEMTEADSVSHLTAHVVATTDGAFSVAWTSEVELTNCVLRTWTNRVDGASEGNVRFCEEFSGVNSDNTNEISTQKAIDYFDTITEETFPWAFYKIFPNGDGTIRIGTKENKDTSNGWLLMPSIPPSTDDLTLHLRVKKKDSNTGDYMPVYKVSGNETNEFAVIALSEDTENFTDYAFPISSLNENEVFSFLISSATSGSRRVVIDSIEIRSGYVAGIETPVTNLVKQVGTGGFAIVSNMPAVKLTAQLEGERKEGNVFSNILIIDLENPMTNAWWRASSFKRNVRSEDFGRVTNMVRNVDGEKTATWVNGETIPGFHAYKRKNAESVVFDIYYDSRARQDAGLYASYTNENNNVSWSISLQGSGDYDSILELRILNDKQKVMNAVTMMYDEYEWLNKNSQTKILTNVYAVATNVLTPPTKWKDVAVVREDASGRWETDLATCGFATNRLEVAIPVTVNPGEVFYYRWIAPKMSNAPMLGIGDLTVTLEWKPGLTLIFR